MYKQNWENTSMPKFKDGEGRKNALIYNKILDLLGSIFIWKIDASALHNASQLLPGLVQL
jgi:hypothetical protein